MTDRTFIESVKAYPDVHEIAATLADEMAEVGRDALITKYGPFIVDVAERALGSPVSDRQAATFMKAWHEKAGTELPEHYADLLEATKTNIERKREKSASDAIAARAAFRRSRSSGPTPPPSTGKVRVSGEIVSTKWEVYEYMGKASRTAKMLVLCRDIDGSEYKVWSTIPKPLRDKVPDIDTLKGSRVTIEAALTPSKDDPKFKIAKWPTLVSHNGVDA